jgi:hypothetical protein
LARAVAETVGGHDDQTAVVRIRQNGIDTLALELYRADDFNGSINVYWAFAQANESVDNQPIGHIWNYGLDRWGWEDTKGRGRGPAGDLAVKST